MELLRPLNDAAFAAQSVAYTGTAGSTAGWPAGPQGVLVWSSTDAYIRVGVGAVATTADTPVPAATPILFFVPPGTGAQWRVSALQVGTAGNVYAKPVNRE